MGLFFFIIIIIIIRKEPSWMKDQGLDRWVIINMFDLESFNSEFRHPVLNLSKLRQSTRYISGTRLCLHDLAQE